MRYSTWLLSQVDELGSQAGFAKTCWDDINNGCASPIYSFTEWIKHFEEKHKANKDILIYRLTQSLGEFKKANEIGEHHG
ncbi:hypothetical protein UFOVP965_113 [uncultured Caudovirales phage]|uniref:Uncharacterized protein n=1 Tax=uncultured Caudovirales phage TaxID=2100421 RepID=A0A6J5Q6B7_9CAUD|nr:hypothetical protein UFOVP965_113 [uncultured Caudovirales phage]CAB4179902.1 hypothetical protein UFOVP1035_109 [uncultured Caudovirales phage]CAB4188726.1 hypothetical protein UFOVP1181_68 [uncultured Caudovirales phage]